MAIKLTFLADSQAAKKWTCIDRDSNLGSIEYFMVCLNVLGSFISYKMLTKLRLLCDLTAEDIQLKQSVRIWLKFKMLVIQSFERLCVVQIKRGFEDKTWDYKTWCMIGRF